MRIRALLIGTSLFVAVPLGCSEPPPPAPPAGTKVVAPVKTSTGVQIKKHNVPVGADPNAIAPGP